MAKATTASWIGLAAALVGAAAARADDPEAGRWLPSLALRVDVQTETDDGSILATNETPPISDPDEPFFRPPVSDDRTFVTAIPDLQLEILSPEIGGLWGRPRLLLHGGWQWGLRVIEEERSVAQEGSPGRVVFPPTAPSAVLRGPPDIFGGQGSELDLHIEDAWYVGLGVAFLVPVGDLELRVRTSADYMQQSNSFDGRLIDVDCEIGMSTQGPGCRKGTEVVRELRASDDETFHALGPRIGVEYDVYETGPLVLSLFADGYVYFVLGDRDVRFGTETPDAKATFSFEKDSQIAGGALGFRVRFRGPVGE